MKFTSFITILNLQVLCILSKLAFEDGSQLQAQIINGTHIRFNVSVPYNHYLSIGYGPSMVNCDMVIWRSMDNSSVVQDLYSTGYKKPHTDSSQDYETTYQYQDGATYFISERKLITDDSQDFDILAGEQEISMIYAFVDSTSDFVKHSGSTDRGTMIMKISKSGEILFEIVPLLDIALIFGWLQFSTWTCLGILQIVAMRYLKLLWKVNVWIHAACGTITTLATVIMGCIGTSEFVLNFHSILGASIMLFTFGAAIFGYFIAFYLRKSQWKTRCNLRMKLVHKIIGYFLIMIAQLAMVTGVLEYHGSNTRKSLIGFLNLVFFFGVWIIAEIIYQYMKRRPVPFYQLPNKISLEEFTMRISKGEHLVILDDMVLDVSKYQFSHPGGKFLLQHNIGRDISKFFYGGYTLENQSISKPWTHSNIARIIVNGLIIGHLVKQSPKFTAKITERHEVNPSTMTFVFQASQQVEGISKYYKDIKMLGQHYLIRSIKAPNVRRQYTISNCLSKDQYRLYQGIIQKALQSESSLQLSVSYAAAEVNLSTVNLVNSFKTSTQMAIETEQDLIDTQQGETEIVVTIKNYRIKSGLSKSIFKDPDQSYEIQGPMGKGLDVQRTGTHIAFSAGTGALAFIDLVAYLIRKNLSLLKPEEDTQIENEGFKFIFYVSFQSKEQSIALDLCFGLQEICSKLNRDNFEFNVRFSNETKDRWDEQFIVAQLEKHEGKISKVWVCGPPKMNEEFDKALAKNADKLTITKQQYEIL